MELPAPLGGKPAQTPSTKRVSLSLDLILSGANKRSRSASTQSIPEANLHKGEDVCNKEEEAVHADIWQLHSQGAAASGTQATDWGDNQRQDYPAFAHVTFRSRETYR